jgi:hypothetical protein
VNAPVWVVVTCWSTAGKSYTYNILSPIIIIIIIIMMMMMMMMMIMIIIIIII